MFWFRHTRIKTGCKMAHNDTDNLTFQCDESNNSATQSHNPSNCGLQMNEKYTNYHFQYLLSGVPDILPEGVEYSTVIPDSKHAIGCGDPVGVGLL